MRTNLPPKKPISGITLFLEDNYNDLHQEFKDLDLIKFKAKVKSRFKVLSKNKRDIYKKNAKIMKEKYYRTLHLYLITYLNYKSEKYMETLNKRLSRKKIIIKSNTLKNDLSREIELSKNLKESKISLKSKYVKKRKLLYKKDIIIKKVLENLLKKMKKAADKDRILNKKYLPAIEKAGLLKEVRQYLQISCYHQYLIEQLYLLDVIRDWLTPLPDKSLPELTVREEMYRIIQLLHLEKYPAADLRDYFLISIKRTQILQEKDFSKLNFKSFGKLIKFLCKHSKETTINRLKLKNFILSWTCSLIGSKCNVLITDSKEILEREKIFKDHKGYVENVVLKCSKEPEKPWFDFLQNAENNFFFNSQKGTYVQECPRRQELIKRFNFLYSKKKKNIFDYRKNN